MMGRHLAMFHGKHSAAEREKRERLRQEIADLCAKPLTGEALSTSERIQIWEKVRTGRMRQSLSPINASGHRRSTEPA